jgi:hypothetical protein
MPSLFVLYSALAVFGVGVTVVDLFGVFDNAAAPSGGGDASGGDDASGAGGTDSDGDSSDGDDADAAGDSVDSEADAAIADDRVESSAAASRDASGGRDMEPAGAARSESGRSGERGSYVASADSGTRLVARAIGTLRLGVYFSLGAGPTGLFALVTGVPSGASLAWSAGAGVFIAVLSKWLRSFVRKDLDSSIKAAEFIMDLATVTVPVLPGAMGKAVVRRYGRETELYVRAKDPAAAFLKGSSARIVDLDDDCFWIESP